jgi:large subunit ribosomal protein L6
MSRIGKKPVDIPGNVKAEIKENTLRIEGPKGKLEHRIPDALKATMKENRIVIERPGSEKSDLSLHGLTRAIIANLVKGVTEGYTKELEIRGVGFKAQVKGSALEMLLGFSHPVSYAIPEGITITTPKPTRIVVTGIDRVKVGEIAAEIRDFYKPEPYTGKGVRYVGEYVRHKAGKTVVK